MPLNSATLHKYARTQIVTGKYYIWEDIDSKNIMKEFQFIKALGKGSTLKVAKIKVARKVNINPKKWNPIPADQRTRGLTGLAVDPHCSSAARGPGSHQRRGFLLSDKMGPIPLQGTCMHTWWPFNSLNQQFEWDLLSKIIKAGPGCNKNRCKQNSMVCQKGVSPTRSRIYAFSRYLPHLACC